MNGLYVSKDDLSQYPKEIFVLDPCIYGTKEERLMCNCNLDIPLDLLPEPF